MALLASSSSSPSVSIAVLNWNGIHHLEHLLPTLRVAVQTYGKPCPVIVLDNHSTGPDRTWLAENFPDVETILAPGNDYLYSYNWLLGERTEDVVILLNNDLKVEPDFIEPLLRHFAKPDTFAVSAKSFDWDGHEVTTGPMRLRRHRGWYFCEPDLANQKPSYTLFAVGGFMAVDRRKYLEIGGFDKLFYPIYGEDLDLSFRAWCRGWTSVYEPDSVVYHRESGTMNSDGSDRSQFMSLRAHFLFHWRNLRQPMFRVEHAVYMKWLKWRKSRQKDAVWRDAHDQAVKLWGERGQEALQNAPDLARLDDFRQKLGRPIAAS